MDRPPSGRRCGQREALLEAAYSRPLWELAAVAVRRLYGARIREVDQDRTPQQIARAFGLEPASSSLPEAALLATCSCRASLEVDSIMR